MTRKLSNAIYIEWVWVGRPTWSCGRNPNGEKFALDDVAAHSIYEDSDLEYLKNEWTKHYFKNYDLRCAAQRQFLGLLTRIVAIQGNPEVNRLMEPVFKRIIVVDFLQGTLVLVALSEVISDLMQSELPTLQAQALGLGKELVAESNASYEAISSKVDDLERIVELSKYS